MKEGYIYLLQNESFGHNVVKIGMTTREPNIRGKELFTTGVPEPFTVALACKVADCSLAEKQIHETLNSYRVNHRREFFIVSIKVAKKVIYDICIKINKKCNLEVHNIIVINNQQEEKNDLIFKESYDDSFTILVNLDRLVPSPIGTSNLTQQQKQRIEIIFNILRDVFNDNLKDHIDNFSRDIEPESEIMIWEQIAKTFLRLDKVIHLNNDKKKEAVSLLLSRSMMSTSKIMKNYKSDILSKKVAKEILRKYDTSPQPIWIK